ncbi:MAG: AI-2E family transporter [Candidatus Colwellbacteria bacterium]|nr:AI-2E family transporter [Candidatus Colwellbacteria bacterium]
MTDQNSFQVSWAGLWRIALMVGFCVFLYLTRETVAVLLLALIFSTVLDRPVDMLEKRRVPRILGTILVYLLAAVLLAFVFYTIIPIAVIEFNNLLTNIGEALDQSADADLWANSALLNPDIQQFTEAILSGGVSFLEILGRLVGSITFVIVTIVMSFYLTVSRDGVKKLLVAIFPDAMEARVISIYNRTKIRIGKWFQAQLLLSCIIGVSVFVGLSLLGVKYALILAVIAAILELIPIVGPIFAGALAVSIALTSSLSLAAYTLLFFIGIQQLENNVLVPLVMRRRTGVHPVMILVAILGGAQIAGLVGILLAVPAAVLIQEMAEEWMTVKTSRRGRRLAV